MGKKLSEGVSFVIGILSGFVLAYAILWTTWPSGARDVQRQAVRQGVAEYRLDTKTGQIAFTWLQHKEETDAK